MYGCFIYPCLEFKSWFSVQLGGHPSVTLSSILARRVNFSFRADINHKILLNDLSSKQLSLIGLLFFRFSIRNGHSLCVERLITN